MGRLTFTIGSGRGKGGQLTENIKNNIENMVCVVEPRLYTFTLAGMRLIFLLSPPLHSVQTSRYARELTHFPVCNSHHNHNPPA